VLADQLDLTETQWHGRIHVATTIATNRMITATEAAICALLSCGLDLRPTGLRRPLRSRGRGSRRTKREAYAAEVARHREWKTHYLEAAMQREPTESYATSATRSSASFGMSTRRGVGRVPASPLSPADRRVPHGEKKARAWVLRRSGTIWGTARLESPHESLSSLRQALQAEARGARVLQCPVPAFGGAQAA
jgi:hypothetical protein